MSSVDLGYFSISLALKVESDSLTQAFRLALLSEHSSRGEVVFHETWKCESRLLLVEKLLPQGT